MFDNDCKPSLEELAEALGGDIQSDGENVLAPGPGHSAEDRSLTVTLADNEDGFICHSFADDDWRVCKDYIKEQLKQPERPVYQKAQSKPYGNHVEYYVYRHEDGENHHRVERTDTKNFFQSHWGGGAWVKDAPSTRIPYRLPELLAADAALPIVLVEGEKDANAAAALGLVTTTIPGGSNSKWTPELAEWFRGRSVVIIPDNDNPGYKYLNNAATHLSGVAGAVHVLELPGLGPRLEKHGKDLSDWLELEGNTPEKLRALIEATPLWEPFKDAAAYEEEIERVARLSTIEYERTRGQAAKALGCRAEALDGLVKKKRSKLGLDKDEEDTKGQGSPISFPEIIIWPAPIVGAELLDAMLAEYTRYLVAPAGSIEAAVLWSVHTHVFDCFNCSPRLGITSAEKQCGKTTLLDLLSTTSYHALSASNISGSSVFRTQELHKPTFLVDEADTFLTENEELRGILNSGHRKGGFVIRTVGDDHEPRKFSTWGPMAIAMIGRLPDTLEDRAVAIRLRRRKKSEPVEGFRIDRVARLLELQRKIARWAEDHTTHLTNADPKMSGLMNRVADNWRPLFAIADASGGKWPETIRKIATGAWATQEDQSIRVQLLRDIKSILDERPDDEIIGSTALADTLGKMETQAWADWRQGKPITPAAVAKLLNEYEIKTDTIRAPGEKPLKAYRVSDFSDAFSTYLPDDKNEPLPPGPVFGVQAVTPKQSNENNGWGNFQAETQGVTLRVLTVTNPSDEVAVESVTVAGRNVTVGVTAQKAENINEINDVTAVTAKVAKNGSGGSGGSSDDLSHADMHSSILCERCGGKAEAENPIIRLPGGAILHLACAEEAAL